MTRYFQERMLYRLSVSPYKERFILKGGALLYAHEHLKARPTLDIDFLGLRISRDLDNIKETFTKLCDIECIEDGVVFDKDSISVEGITLKKEYNGVRVHIKVGLDTASQVISMDIGFGDIITPAPVDLSYPVLLDSLPEVDILAYSLETVETVVAEKYQAMIDHATENSRMKDFFDVYRILKAGEIDLNTLQEAITATFENRGTAISTDYSLFEDSFATDAKRNIMWLFEETQIQGTVDFPRSLDIYHAGTETIHGKIKALRIYIVKLSYLEDFFMPCKKIAEAV